MRNFKQILYLFGMTLFIALMLVHPAVAVEKGWTGSKDSPVHLPDNVQGLRQWYLEDQAYLQSGTGRNYHKEIRTLRTAMEKLVSHPEYRDPSGFSVYSPMTTGRIHLLAAAITARKNPGEKYPYDELLGHQLHDENPDQYPDIKRVIRLLKGIPMPKRALDGFKVYLLPYSMGDANGYGGDGYTFLAAAPAGETLIPNQLEVTLAHELGHHLHFRFMDRSTVQGQKLWDAYLKIRGISWKSGGEAGSKAWTLSSEEVFAEDFRVWKAGDAVGSGYFGDLSYPDPTKKQGEALRKFFENLPSKPMSTEDNPWADESHPGMGNFRTVFPYITMALLGIPLVYQIRTKRSGQ